ncbi:MAG: DNA methyltransferase [bacterium]|nr:DNA methyltransferase [bacterium]
MLATQTKTLVDLDRLKPSPEWAFANSGRSETNYITHGYHRYPAKFIPNIVKKLIEDYTEPGDVVVDPFGGCGTTLVEAKISGRKSYGFDINPVAKLISQVKITPIYPKTLENSLKKFERYIQLRPAEFSITNERLYHWFSKTTIEELNVIYSAIKSLKDYNVRRFYLCAFSHILKNCSHWLMKSIKPQVDPEKIPPKPIDVFRKHLQFMIKRNNSFFFLLKEAGRLDTPAKMRIADSTKRLPLQDHGIDLIITSPPYVTSYEYADLHQLSLLWFGNDKHFFKKWGRHIKDYNGFRKKFIGSSIRKIRRDGDLNSDIGDGIVKKLFQRDFSVAKGVTHYFLDMNKSFNEMFRILKRGGRACVIIGDTNLCGIEISNSEVATEQMQNIGFRPLEFIKREITNKMITPWRDPKSGHFTSHSNPGKKRVYQFEYILVMEKV